MPTYGSSVDIGGSFTDIGLLETYGTIHTKNGRAP